MASNNKRPPVRTLIILSVVSILLALGMAEIFLRLVDPYGMLRLQAENRTRYENQIPLSDGIGYRLPAGRHQITDDLAWTILGDGSRLVTHSDPSSNCKIVAIGDSMTFGAGVNDDENWVTLWSQDNDYNIINAGRTATNAVEAAAMMDYYPADGYVWFFIYNDDNVTRTYRPATPQPSAPAIVQYLRYQWVPSGSSGRTVDSAAFLEAATRIYEQGALLMTHDDNNLIELLPEEMREELVLIPWYSTFISRMDQHPDPAGHHEIYEGFAPHLADYAGEVCSQDDETS
jgi:hypothetical protein